MIDETAFCEHIRQYEKPMYFLALSIVKNDSDAEEVISESIYRAYKNLNTLKNEKYFKTWLLHIVHNTAVEAIRKSSKVIHSAEILESQSRTCENEIATKLALRDAVESLKLPYRTVVVLFYYENLSVSDIARITNTSSAAVKKQLSRARKMLFDILKEDFDG